MSWDKLATFLMSMVALFIWMGIILWVVRRVEALEKYVGALQRFVIDLQKERLDELLQREAVEALKKRNREEEN